ncbi:DUF559 domain-containing protein [Demequina subtropica]|uniref:DUF559 domain-containing protein n=1 Tax=Demequina subtropica TaxID=1638989 RepID=UPI000783370B|nr:DUF559 domain-containing protein [Demequina subtropica]
MDVLGFLAREGGAARLEALLTAGASENEVRRAVARGMIHRPLRGCYALPNATRAAILRASYRASLCCTSMCEAHKLPVIARDGIVHLVVPRDRARRATDRRPSDGLVLHRLDPVAGLPTNRIAFGLDMLGRCADRMQQIVAVDAALHRGMISRADILRFALTDPVRRRWLYEMADGASESLLETIVRVALVEAGLSVRSQARVPGAGRVDLLVEGRIVVQTDGDEHHSSPADVAEDKRRDRACLAAKLPALRFTYREVMGDIEGVVREVLRVLTR